MQLHHPSTLGGTRPPIGVSSVVRVQHGAPGASGAATTASSPGWDETFSLEPGELDFGAIIRLTLDLVDEIMRIEAQGGAARIKFDSNANNSCRNVIDVGGKEFRFKNIKMGKMGMDCLLSVVLRGESLMYSESWMSLPKTMLRCDTRRLSACLNLEKLLC